MSAPRPKLIWIGNMVNPAYLEVLTHLAKDLGVELKCRIGVTDEALMDLLNRAAALIYVPRLEPLSMYPG